MPKLRRCALLLATSLTLAAALPTSAVAASTHHISFTLTDAIVAHGSGTGTSAGVFSGRPFGNGAVVQRIAVTSITGSTATTKATFTIFTTKGTLKGTGRSTRTTQPDGTVSISASRTITGGTGAYQGARGRVTVTGTTRNGITTSHWVGTVRY